ncbi:GTPase [Agrobacterium vitis]|uniref:GTPase n=1 Tax=Allorhizobium ampelinum TaxID=3025782 RepID=UPI001F19F5EE|nr:GTPase [Allorhizobium ampelinum]MCF1464205.1 GTPase [Allorhizobium ampelinum]
MTMPLAHYLKDFSAPRPAPMAAEPVSFNDDALMFPDMPMLELPQPDPVDVEKERQDAYAEGHDAAVKAADERHAEALSTLEKAHAEALQELTEKHQAELARVIAEGLQQIASDLSRIVGSQTVETLAPLLSDLLVDKALEDISGLLKAAVLEGAAGQITVTGPAALFKQLADLMEGQDLLLKHVEADDLDLTVDVGGAALVTRISAWTASLKKVLA